MQIRQVATQSPRIAKVDPMQFQPNLLNGIAECKSKKISQICQTDHSQRKTMSEHIKNVSDASFDADVIKSSQPVLVDYWAAWCGPCKQIAPMLEEVAAQYAGKMTVAKLNVDENQATAGNFGIRGIPTLMLFKDGKVADTKVGALSKAQLTAWLDSAI